LKSCWKVFLRYTLLLALITVSITPVASECSSGNKNESENESCAEEALFSSEIDPSSRSGVIGESFKFLTSMLGLLDVTLRLSNSTLEAHASEYPFLAGTLEGTSEGVEALDSMLVVMDPDQRVVNRTSLEEVGQQEKSLNESLEEFNSSSGAQARMLEAANSTLGEENVTSELLNSMYASLKRMAGSRD